MSPHGYDRRLAPPLGYDRSTSGSRRSHSNVGFLRFSSALRHAADNRSSASRSSARRRSSFNQAVGVQRGELLLCIEATRQRPSLL